MKKKFHYISMHVLLAVYFAWFHAHSVLPFSFLCELLRLKILLKCVKDKQPLLIKNSQVIGNKSALFYAGVFVSRSNNSGGRSTRLLSSAAEFYSHLCQWPALGFQCIFFLVILQKIPMTYINVIISAFPMGKLRFIVVNYPQIKEQVSVRT